MGPPLVDEDWHAVRQAICKGVEGADWEKLYYKFVDMNKAVSVRHAKWEEQGQDPVEKRCQDERRRELRSDQ